MNGNRHPEHIPLLIAVLDGEDPKAWPPFDNKLFPELIAAAQKAAKPYAVPRYLLDRYKVEVLPLLVGPRALLEDNHLDKIVGVIIDALPKDNAEEDQFYQRKLDTLLSLYVNQVGNNGEPLFKRFGYKVWFVTKDTESVKIASFVQNVRNALAARLKGVAYIDYDFILEEEERVLTAQLSLYMANAYFILAEGLIR